MINNNKVLYSAKNFERLSFHTSISNNGVNHIIILFYGKMK